MSHVNVIPVSRPMVPRDPNEKGRAATPLELFFDLVFVTAIASAAAQLHHGVAEGHWDALGGYAMAFAAIWWAWVGYTWFASAYDNDDVIFRVLSFVIMAGSLIMAAGIPELFETGQSVVAVAGYAVMRLGMVALWLRAARDDPQNRPIALKYAAGITVVQVFWILRLLIDNEQLIVVTFILGMAAELAVPFVAERRGHSSFHPEHAAERSGLLAIIVIGEVVLASVAAINEAMSGDSHATADLVFLVLGAFLVMASIWWLYFRREHDDLIASEHGVWAFGYLHYLIYGSIAAFGAGAAASVEVATHHAHVGAQPVEWFVAGTISVFVMTLAVLHLLGGDDVMTTIAPAVVMSVGTLVIAAIAPPIGLSVLLMGLVLAIGVAVHLVRDRATVTA